MQASEVLRFIAFGEIHAMPRGNEGNKLAYQDSIGTKDQVRSLVSLWRAMDEDRSERVDLVEFKNCVQQRLVERFEEIAPNQVLPSWAAVAPGGEASSKLIDRLCKRVASELFGSKSSFSLTDFINLLWLRASPADLKTMKAWFQEICEEATRIRVKTPPVLDPSEYRNLCAVFKHFDCEDRKELSFDDLVRLGLINADQVEQTWQEWDRDGNGKLNQSEFCEMMCPLGHRATVQSTIGTMDDSRIVVFDSTLGEWKLSECSAAAAAA